VWVALRARRRTWWPGGAGRTLGDRKAPRGSAPDPGDPRRGLVGPNPQAGPEELGPTADATANAGPPPRRRAVRRRPAHRERRSGAWWRQARWARVRPALANRVGEEGGLRCGWRCPRRVREQRERGARNGRWATTKRPAPSRAPPGPSLPGALDEFGTYGVPFSSSSLCWAENHGQNRRNSAQPPTRPPTPNPSLIAEPSARAPPTMNAGAAHPDGNETPTGGRYRQPRHRPPRARTR